MIQRARQFSPNSVEKDLAILEAVADRLRQKGCEVETVSEEDILRQDALGDTPGTVPSVRSLQSTGGLSPVCPPCVLSMGRLPETLSWLETLSVRTINTPQGVRNCTRSTLQRIMEQTGTPVPPQEGPDGYWLKRGDAAAQSPEDVVFAVDREALRQAIADMEQRGISDYVVSAHVKGDLVKFYGVSGTGFFHTCYPTDDGQTKFGDECRNGAAHHYPFDVQVLQAACERLAETVGVVVYGGDCIVREDGSFCLIDFNDWPSFSRCRNEAADAIASLVKVKR